MTKELILQLCEKGKMQRLEKNRDKPARKLKTAEEILKEMEKENDCGGDDGRDNRGDHG